MNSIKEFLALYRELDCMRQYAHFEEAELMQTASTVFKEARKELALTQAKLGAALGVTGSYICKIEAGEARPSVKVRARLATFAKELERKEA